MIDAIDNFVAEFAEAAKARGLVTADHLRTIEMALVNAHDAAGSDPGFVDLWDSIAAHIGRRDLSPTERLAGLRPIAERFEEARRGRAH